MSSLVSLAQLFTFSLKLSLVSRLRDGGSVLLVATVVEVVALGRTKFTSAARASLIVYLII
jgi:hypothetical protein